MKYLINLTSYTGKKLSWIQNFLSALFGTVIIALIDHIKSGIETNIFVFYLVNIFFLISGLITVTGLMDRYGYYLAEFKGDGGSGDFRNFYADRQNIRDKVYQLLFYVFLIGSMVMLGLTIYQDLNTPDKIQKIGIAIDRTEKKTELILNKSEEIRLLIDQKKDLGDSISSLNVIIKKQTSVIDSLKGIK
ncbi:hypothetical protein [Croceitalea rosinachiae]|uniref:Uncharacterized protein n=1 Tax=Croceitalea rosinachiae TaxID=3075596 RepID=A0ABU3ADR5_9FLAO|nr:hypothetical protein [Croceitalea sp. F388]MDT0608040.1 hypothetical protein [Croceitalea sp. F388]